jgi:hypothetical protein
MDPDNMHVATAIIDSFNGECASDLEYMGRMYSRKPRLAWGSLLGRTYRVKKKHKAWSSGGPRRVGDGEGVGNRLGAENSLDSSKIGVKSMTWAEEDEALYCRSSFL